MRIIELDASGWRSPVDFLQALRVAIGGPDWHGLSPDAFIDSMIWGRINSIEPPYAVRITGTTGIPTEVTDYISLIVRAIREGRQWRLANRGTDVEVTLQAPELQE